MNKVKLNDIAEIQTGLSYRRYLQEDGQEFSVIVQRSIQKDGILKDFEKVSLTPENIKPHHFTKPGDVLMKMPYPYDVVCVSHPGLVVSDRIAIIRLNPHHDPSFIAHLLTNAHVKKQLYELSSTERIPHASLRQIKEIELVLPDSETQRKYGKLLDTINEKLYEDQKVVEYDRNLKEGILNRLWGEF
ncbi:restriction endonuclease subunit S [Methanobrevibacter sp.]|uniref:restriction endonuclease subunit S n=1 Tax=Methanobrevibacter sp. TaxID=66852 RepID=UPI003869D30C